jgi:hypothetical protein
MIVGTAVDDQSSSVACQGSGTGGGYACDTRNISVEWYGQTEVGPSGEGFPHDLIASAELRIARATIQKLGHCM